MFDNEEDEYKYVGKWERSHWDMVMMFSKVGPNSMKKGYKNVTYYSSSFKSLFEFIIFILLSYRINENEQKFNKQQYNNNYILVYYHNRSYNKHCLKKDS